jgi:uncharacterized protein (DUF983 family)
VVVGCGRGRLFAIFFAVAYAPKPCRLTVRHE